MERPPEIRAELENAERARQRGNEGQARVCARRAAGLAARQYLARRGRPPRSSSAYDVLRLIEADADLSAHVREIAAHLTLQVDEDFKLPADIDLIAEAGQLCDALLNASPTE